MYYPSFIWQKDITHRLSKISILSKITMLPKISKISKITGNVRRYLLPVGLVGKEKAIGKIIVSTFPHGRKSNSQVFGKFVDSFKDHTVITQSQCHQLEGQENELQDQCQSRYQAGDAYLECKRDGKPINTTLEMTDSAIILTPDNESIPYDIELYKPRINDNIHSVLRTGITILYGYLFLKMTIG